MMSKYTILLGDLVGRDYYENNTNITKYNLNMDKYPIFDENYRNTLNKKIYDHYRFREIGQETPDLFRHYLNTTMNEIMSYYNEIYKYQNDMLSKDIFENYEQTEEMTKNIEGESSSTSASSGTGNNKAVFNDTPQGEIVSQNVDDYKFASNVSISEAENTNSINDFSELNNTENYVKKMTGSIGARYKPEVIGLFIKNLMNIDMEIIEKLDSLFMQIY